MFVYCAWLDAVIVVIKYPNKNNLKEKVYLGSQSKVQLRMVGKSRQKATEAAGHIVSTVKEQRAMSSAFSLAQDPLPKEWICPQPAWVFRSHLIVIKMIPQGHIQSPISQVILYSLKLTLNINHHRYQASDYPSHRGKKYLLLRTLPWRKMSK